MLSHHIKKKGLNRVKVNPITSEEPLLKLLTLLGALLMASRNCNIPKAINEEPPTKLTTSLVLRSFMTVESPKAKQRTRGNSAKVCPKLATIPPLYPLLKPNVATATVKGPGDNAPEALMSITLARNPKGKVATVGCYASSFISFYLIILPPLNTVL